MSESAGFVTIKDLAGATLATEDDDLIIQQGEETKRINLKTLGDLLVFLDKIEQVKTSTENAGINEIKATLSDGSTATFTTQNGHGIQKIEQTVKSDVSSGTNVITATLSDGQKSNFEIKNGDQGDKGDTGAALIDVVQKETSAVSGGKNVISFKLNDGSYKDVEVYNGAKGETGEVSQEVLNQTVNEAIAGVVANAPEDFDTLKEMSDWISEHEDDATAMNTAILENKNSIANIFNSSSLVSDFNTTTKPGLYQWTTSSSNRPNNRGVLLVNKYSGGGNFWINQIAYSTSKKIYFRQKINSDEWTRWETISYISDLANWSVKNYDYTDNINDCEPGTWCSVNTDANSINMPFAKGWANILTFWINENPLYKQQICFYQYVDTLYIRTQIGGVWSKWVRLANQDDVNIKYSTAPQKIGTWIDGKDVYRVVIENELEGNVVGQLAGTVESGATIISAKGQITDVMDETYIVPCFSYNSRIGLRIEGNSIYFVGDSNTSFTNVKLVVEYTK